MGKPSWFRDLAARVAKREGKKKSAVNVAQASEVIAILCEELAQSTRDGAGLVGEMVSLGIKRLKAKRKRSSRNTLL